MREQFEKMFEHVPGNYLEPVEVEQALGFFTGQIKQWICRGTMPFPYTKIRSRTRIRKDALIDWLMSNERQPDGTTLAPASPAPVQVPSVSVKRRGPGRPPKVRDLAREAAYANPRV